MLLAPINIGIEPDQTASVGPEGCRDRIEDDLHISTTPHTLAHLDIDTTLTVLHTRLDHSADRTVLCDSDVFKFEMLLLLEVELIHIPRATVSHLVGV